MPESVRKSIPTHCGIVSLLTCSKMVRIYGPSRFSWAIPRSRGEDLTGRTGVHIGGVNRAVLPVIDIRGLSTRSDDPHFPYHHGLGRKRIEIHGRDSVGRGVDHL